MILNNYFLRWRNYELNEVAQEACTQRYAPKRNTYQKTRDKF